MNPLKKKDKKEEGEEYIISQRHDKFFRGALDHLPVAKELIEKHLLPELKKHVDFDTLKPEKDSFISKSLKKSICDVLFSAKTHEGKECLFLLIEAQSKPDYWMAFRLMKYMLSICTRYLKNNKEATRLPLVWPLVIYQGEQEYNVVRNFWELFASPELAKKLWTEDHVVVSVREVSDEELLQEIWSGSLKWALKHIFDKDLIKSWQQMKEVIPQLAEAGDIGLDYLELMFNYTCTTIGEDDKINLQKLLESCLAKEEEVRIMGSLAQHWRDEGIGIGEARGIEKGIEKTAVNMLKQNLDIKLVAKVTGLSMLEVQKLKAKL